MSNFFYLFDSSAISVLSQLSVTVQTDVVAGMPIGLLLALTAPTTIVPVLATVLQLQSINAAVQGVGPISATIQETNAVQVTVQNSQSISGQVTEE